MCWQCETSWKQPSNSEHKDVCTWTFSFLMYMNFDYPKRKWFWPTQQHLEPNIKRTLKKLEKSISFVGRQLAGETKVGCDCGRGTNQVSPSARKSCEPIQWMRGNVCSFFWQNGWFLMFSCTGSNPLWKRL